MAKYRRATWLPLPENTTQPRITPTHLILHSAAAPWSPKRLRDFWNERGVTTESHFGVGYDGAVGQFMDTHVPADANASANNRAISVESADDTKNAALDPRPNRHPGRDHGLGAPDTRNSGAHLPL